MTHPPPAILAVPTRPEAVVRALRRVGESALAIEAAVPGFDDGRAAELVLRERATGEERRRLLAPAGGGGFEAVLDLASPEPAEWVGTWAAYLVAGPDEPWRRLIARPDEVIDPILVRHGDAGLEVTPRATLDRGLSFDVRPLPHLRRVLVGDDGAVSVEGVLPVRGRRAGAMLCRRRRAPDEVRAEATVGDGRFAARVDLRALVRGGARHVWDLWLEVDGVDRPLRIGARLDPMPGKRRRWVYPRRTVRRAGTRRTMEPYITVKDNLSVDSWPPGSPPPVALPSQVPDRRLRARPWQPLTTAGLHVAHRLALALLPALPRRPRPVSRAGRPRVCIVILNAYGLGGTIRSVLTLAEDLSRRFDVEIVSVMRRRRRAFMPLPAGVEVTTLDDARPYAPRPWLRRALEKCPSLLIHRRDHGFGACTMWTDLQLARKLRSLDADVLVTTRPALNLLAARLAPARTLTVGQEHMNFHAHHPALARELRRSYRRLDVLTVLTHDDRGDYGELLASAHTRVARIPNALPALEGERADPAAPVIVAAGRLTEQKGFDLLIDAYAGVAAHRPGWTLRIYGGGADRDALRAMIFERELYNEVFLMGPSRRLGHELAQGSIFALSSRYEGFGMVLLEAMSKGMAVVSFDCPRGPSELIHDGRDGVLVPTGDVPAFAQALLALTADEDARRRLGAAALQKSLRFERAEIGRMWDELLDDALAGKARGVDVPPGGARVP